MRYKHSDENLLTDEELAGVIAPFTTKFQWFLKHGYNPHYWQILFHTLAKEDATLCRFRSLVAGRRGGKTLSAAWEVLYYLLNPKEWYWDFRKEERDDPIRVWALAKDFPTGTEALFTLREVIAQVGLKHSVDYKEHRGNRWFEFSNGSFLQFRSADDPQSLRGAGLNMLWIDEAAFIPNDEAYLVVRPALADRLGGVICTTTPAGKNWYYEEFFGPSTEDDPEVGSVEYTSVNNPYFSEEEWKREQQRYHPFLFKQEYLASFDAQAGRELMGDWLHFYQITDLPKKDGKYQLDTYIGVDPAISLSDASDRFVISAIGVAKDHSQTYLLEQWAGKIPFPEQVEMIADWHRRFKPIYIGIEATAYQNALAQQTMRLQNIPPVVAVFAKGKKFERILSMAPTFKIGRVLIRKDHKDFIDEWLNYDSSLRNPKDDCLDSVEIALRVAGVLFPEDLRVETLDPPRLGLQETADWEIEQLHAGGKRETKYFDEQLGGEW